jgi:hypothetical protein
MERRVGCETMRDLVGSGCRMWLMVRRRRGERCDCGHERWDDDGVISATV